jgi:hypothetical protein
LFTDVSKELNAFIFRVILKKEAVHFFERREAMTQQPTAPGSSKRLVGTSSFVHSLLIAIFDVLL